MGNAKLSCRDTAWWSRERLTSWSHTPHGPIHTGFPFGVNYRPHQVMLHWFQRDQDGITQISSTEVDDTSVGAMAESTSIKKNRRLTGQRGS